MSTVDNLTPSEGGDPHRDGGRPSRHPEFDSNVGSNVRYLRTRADIGQRELAALADMDEALLAGVEDGRDGLTFRQALAVAEALAVTPERLAAATAAHGSPEPPPLRIVTLGPLELECGGTDLGGEWLEHRPGHLLKYLIWARGRRVRVAELIDRLWPGAGSQGLVSVRQAVHGLRDRLEPTREKHTPSRFILARSNAYELAAAEVVVDADVFEREAEAALLAAEPGSGADALERLARAALLYRGEFLADEPYSEWALTERARLHSLAARVLRALAGAQQAAGEPAAATSALQRLTDLDPLDLDAQRELMTVLIRSRRHGEAARRYEVVSRQFKRAFGTELDFELADLV